MGEESDYLTLWAHFEGRGYDDKNRMIATASILISVSSGLFAAAVTCMTGSPPQLWTAVLIAFLSTVVAIVSLVLVGFFAGHASRNFNSADVIKDQFGKPAKMPLKDLLNTIKDVREKQGGWQVHLLGAGKWLSTFDVDKKRQKYAGPIFLYFWAFSLLMSVLSASVVGIAAYNML